MQNRVKKSEGITLLELLIVLVIVALLTGIAIPSYRGQVTKARRSDGLVSLLDLTTRIERYFAEHNTFVGATVGDLMSSDKSPEGYYDLSLSHLTVTTYTASAAPVAPQLNADEKCGTLSINELGQKSISGAGTVAQCWR